MKKKILMSVVAVFVMAVGVFAYAFTATPASAGNTMSCCKGDSCPMKKKNTAAKDTASCCDDCDCCSGDSCPMKSKRTKVSTTGDAKDCDCSCCSHDKETAAA